MSLLFRIVYAAHANGSHHKLALDGLARLTIANAEAWQRVFLKHADLFMQGAKAPDVEFKDFKNHVLHVGDNYWGGAPEKATSWYRDLVTALREGRWEDAVYGAGVLSHYVTDPVHPFHTAQSQAENNIHRAVEWSINRSYDTLKTEALRDHPALLVKAGDGPQWLTDLVCRGAETSNRHYGALIAHYDINVGVVDPPAGLDGVARRIVGELILYAADSFARVLERAISDADVSPPAVTLTAETFLATLAMPRKWLQKRLANAEDRRIVEAMYDELMATGRVEDALPEDDRTVRDLHEREVLAPQRAMQAEARSGRMPVAAPEPAAPIAVEAVPANRFAAALGPVPAVAKPSSSLADRLERAARPAEPNPTEAMRARRRALAEGDNVEAAPAIGPRLAERLGRAGVTTVAHLLAADAAELAGVIGVRQITTDTVTGWQDATRLVMAVPIINGTEAQLLIGAGLRSVQTIASADPVQISAALLRFATTPDGQRLLRDGRTADVEKIKTWIDESIAALGKAA